MLGIYAVMLAAWGLWHHRREAEPVSPPEVEPAVVAAPAHKRGAAARHHLNARS